MASCLRHLNPKKTLFLLCDIQEKFRSSIPLFANLLENANKLVRLQMFSIYLWNNLYIL